MAASNQSDFEMEAPDFLSNGSLLKPTLDTIFAEVEKSLPSIDFEVSDVSSSEEDVPIFHRSLKTPTQDDEDYDTADDFLEASTSKLANLKVTDTRPATFMSNVSDITAGLNIGSAASKMLKELNVDPRSDPLSMITSALDERSKPPEVLRNTWMKSEAHSSSSRADKRREVPELSPEPVKGKKRAGKPAIQSMKVPQHAAGDDVRVVSKYLSAKGPTLPLEKIQIDEIVDIALARLPSDQTTSTPVLPSAETEPAPPSLIQRLAQLSILESGTELSDIDPSSGALKASGIRQGLVDLSAETNKQNNALTTGTCMTRPGTTDVLVAATDLRKDLPNLPRSRLTQSPPSQKKPEPETIFLDLRGFEKEKREQKESVERVQRVLGIKAPDAQSSSDSDSDDDTLLWHEQRRKIKESLTNSPHQTKSGPPGRVSAATTTRSAPAPPPTVKPSKPTTPDTHQPSPAISQSLTSDPVTPDPSKVSADPDVTSVSSTEAATKDREQKAQAAKRAREKRESDRQSRLRLGQRLEAVKPSMSDRGRCACAEATQTLFDIEVSYEPAPLTLPSEATNELEVVLLSIVLSSNGEMVHHRGSTHKSVDPGLGLSASYTTLLTWLLSLVPDDFHFLQATPAVCLSPAPFHVIGLQQMYLGGELRLYIAVTPVERFSKKDAPLKKTKSRKRDEFKDSSPFQQILTKYFSVNTLHTVCPWLQDMISMDVSKGNHGYIEGEFVYRPPLPNITTRPLSTFIHINPDAQAAHKVLQSPPGFFWETVDSEDTSFDHAMDETDLSYDTQSTMSLIYKKVYSEPCAMMGILNRTLQEGFNLAGLRLMYPTPALLNLSPKNTGLPEMSKEQTSLDMLNHIGPILAMALRGTHARALWLDAVGPSDPALARRTDPNSLCALYGGESRDECLLFCPRNPDRIFTELCRWFGGRVPASGVIDVGVKERPNSASKRSKKSKSAAMPSHRPAALLTATSRSDVVVAVSPLVPIRCLGLILATCQRRGYQLRGIRRTHLSAKKANALGLSGDVQSVFTGDTVFLRAASSPPPPCCLLLVHKENAAHSAASLVENFAVQMSLQGILGDIADVVQLQSDLQLTSALLFRASPYSEGLMATLGGDFTTVPDADLSPVPGYITPQLYSHPELEQIVVLTLTGHQLLKTFGLFIGRLLGVVPYSKHRASPGALPRPLELLGVKWLPSLSLQHAKELTPYEVGDSAWKSSVHKLTSEPAVVLALRGVSAFSVLDDFIAARSPASDCLELVVSPTPETAYHQARMFFTDRELHADGDARWTTEYMPPARQQHAGDRSSPMTESIYHTMLSGPRPLTSVMIVKPDVVARSLGKLLRRVVQEGFVIVAARYVILGGEYACVAVPEDDREDEVLSQMHVDYLSSAPSLVLAVQRENAVKRLCDLIGPSEPQQARRQGAGLWRAVFGTDPICNGLHASADYLTSVSELKLFFPDGVCCRESLDLQAEQIASPAVDSVADLTAYRQRDVVYRDPRDGQPQPATRSSGTTVRRHVLPVSALTQTNVVLLSPPLSVLPPRSKRLPLVDVIDTIRAKGFELVGARLLWLTETQAQDYLHLTDAGSFSLVPVLRSGPSLVLAVQRDNAIMAFNSLLGSDIGRDSIFAKYDDKILRCKDKEHASRLLRYFFDELIPASHAQIVPASDKSASK